MAMQRIAVVLTGVNVILLLGTLFWARPTFAQTTSSLVRAQAIELVDAQGRPRAQLNVEASGEAVFRMRDATGTIRVKLGASESGSAIVLLDESTEPAVHVLATRDGTSLTLKKGNQQQVLRP